MGTGEFFESEWRRGASGPTFAAGRFGAPQGSVFTFEEIRTDRSEMRFHAQNGVQISRF
jgi:hypothetical protein